MKYLCAVFALAFLAPHARPGEYDVRAALALASAKPEAVPARSAKLDKHDYAACLAESARTGKHLAVWVGYACISSERQLGDLIHCHLDEGSLPGVPGQVVLVGVPRNGIVEEKARIPVDEVCALTIRQGCRGEYKTGKVTRAQVRASGG